MGVKPKKFYCTACDTTYYTDMDVCNSCKERDSIKPLKKAQYVLYLNGAMYGIGGLTYMHELIHDYLITNKMYNKSKCSFEIKEILLDHENK